MLAMEAADVVQHLGQADQIGMEHRPAAPCRETVAIDINDIDVARP